MTAIYSNVYAIEEWKAEMLSHVVDAFASSNQGDIQKSISAWRYSEELPFPTAADIRINGGSLTFGLLINGEEVFFSLWYTFGEVRLGVRVPHNLLDNTNVTNIEKKLIAAYDGSPCQKITTLSSGKFFDWIFRDTGEGFASFMTGLKATQDTGIAILIASRLADILTHVYMATMNILIENGGLKVTFKEIKSPLSANYVTLEVRGALDTFEYWVKRQATIEKKIPWSEGKTHYLISGDKSIFAISLGDYEIDGSYFSILDRVNENTQKLLYPVREPALDSV